MVDPNWATNLKIQLSALQVTSSADSDPYPKLDYSTSEIEAGLTNMECLAKQVRDHMVELET